MINEVTAYEYNGKLYLNKMLAQKAMDRNSKYVMFELSMPNVGSWNGRWSGENNAYTIKMKLSKELDHLKGQSFYYNFGDGWGASVSCREIKPKEKATNKFCGYEWMIRSILKHGDIRLEK